MKQKFLYSLAIAAVFAFPMDSARKRQRTEDFNSVDNTKSSIDFNQLLTLKLWEKPKKYVYLQPSDETETNRDDFKEKFTVDSEIFNQLPLIKNLLADDEENNVLHDSEQTTAHEVRLLNVKSDILTALLNFASWISTNQIEFNNVDDLSILFKLLNAANYVEFNILIKVCIKTIAQKFDSSSLENTVSNLKLDRKEILNHESIVQNNVITYEAVFRQLETQYRVASDMMIQIYKSIPLSSLVRLNAPVKIIGALFIAFTSNEAYMTNDEIEIYLNHKDAESIGYSLLKAFKDNTTISHLLPDLGYKLDDNGNKHLLTVEDEDEKSLLKAATHPYIFEFIWSIYLRDPREYFAIYCKFNRKDIIEIIYESTKGLEDARLKRKVSDTFTDELYLAFNHGHVLSTKYLVETVGAAFDNQYYKWNNYKYAFRIKEMEKRLRFLNFLYRSKVICSSEIFDAEAKKGNYENVVWLVEHEYSGTFHHIEFELKKMGTLDEQKQKVLDYLRANQLMKWNHGGAFSCGNYNGPTPRTF